MDHMIHGPSNRVSKRYVLTGLYGANDSAHDDRCFSFRPIRTMRCSSSFGEQKSKAPYSERKSTRFSARFQPNYSNLLSLSDSRSEEHTSELQSRLHLVCRLLLEKKKKRK